jgi:hypothetical protein
MLLSLLVILSQNTPAPGRAPAGLAPVPPPVEQYRADCTNPTYASDMLVCSTPALLDLDARMAKLLLGGSGPIASASELIESQSGWFKRRSMCAFQARHAECLRAAYRERISMLEALAGKRDGKVRICTRKGPLEGAELILASNGAAIAWRAGNPIAAGLWQFDPKLWKPFISVFSARKMWTVLLPGGSRTIC